MNLKEKVKSYSFWVSLASAIVLVLKVIGSNFGFTIDATLASDLITSMCSVLVILGIIVTPTPKTSQINEINKETINTTDDVKPQTAPSDTFTNDCSTENIELDLIQTNEQLSQKQQTECIDENINNTLDNTNSLMVENNFENIEPETNYTLTNQSESNSTDIETYDCANELKNLFIVEKEKFKDNISTYIELLENEINNTKNNIG